MGDAPKYVQGEPWTWMGTHKPYGGYIVDINIRIGYNGPATASLTIVSEDGTYSIDKSSLNVDACGVEGKGTGPSPLRLLFLDSGEGKDSVEVGWRMYPHSYSISDGSGGTVLTVDLVEESMDYFNKVLVINKKYKPTDARRSVAGVIYVGDEYYNDSTSTRSELVRRSTMLERVKLKGTPTLAQREAAPYKNPEAAEMARTQFGDWLWTPKDLGVELGKGSTAVPMSDAAIDLLKNYDDIYLGSQGYTLQAALREIGSLLGVMFFWDSVEKKLDVMGEANCLALMTPQGHLKLDADTKAILVSQNIDVSLRDTRIASQAQRAAMASGEPGNPKFQVEVISKALSPIFGKVPKQSDPFGSLSSVEGADSLRLFDPDHVLLEKDAVAPNSEDLKQGFQALNLIKALMLGEEFARVYILLKKIGAHQAAVGTGFGRLDPFEGVDPAEKITNFELVELLFPSPPGTYTTETNTDTNGDGLLVTSPAGTFPEGNFDPDDKFKKVVLTPKNPYWAARFLLLWQERHPFQHGELSNIPPGDSALEHLVKGYTVAYVKQYKSPVKAAAQNSPKSGGVYSIHGILNSSWDNECYKTLRLWSQYLNRYFVIRGEYAPTCPDSQDDSAEAFNQSIYVYEHRNWPAVPKELERLTPVNSAMPDSPAQYVNSQDDEIMRVLGTCFYKDFLSPDTQTPTAADFVENITLGNNGPVTKGDEAWTCVAGLPNNSTEGIGRENSCLRPIDKKQLKLATEIDKANCKINRRDSIRIWEAPVKDLTTKITAAQKKTAQEWVDKYYYFDPVTSQQEQNILTNENYYSCVMLPLLTEEPSAAQTIIRYYKNTKDEGDDPPAYDFKEIFLEARDFAGVDQIDMFLNSIDIGIDPNGFINPPNIAFMEAPDRYEHNEGVIKGTCLPGSFYNGSFNPVEHGGKKLMTMIPELGTEGAGTDDAGDPKPRGSFEGMEYTLECDKEKEGAVLYDGVPEATQQKIKKNLKVNAQSLFDLAQRTDPSLSYTCRTQGAPAKFPSVQQGLSNLSVSVGPEGPVTTYTVGNKNFRATQEAQRSQLVRVPGGGTEIGEDPFMQKFSQKFMNKLEQKPSPRAPSKRQGPPASQPPPPPPASSAAPKDPFA